MSDNDIVDNNMIFHNESISTLFILKQKAVSAISAGLKCETRYSCCC